MAKVKIHSIFGYIVDNPDAPLIPFCGIELSRETFKDWGERDGKPDPVKECGNCARTKNYKIHVLGKLSSR